MKSIIELAKQAGFERVIDVNPHTGIRTVEAYAPDSLERFANLVRAEVLEEAAGVCERIDTAAFGVERPAPNDCAAAIRQLKEKT
jgi:sugar phosphate isomerase/epimerase